jgi:hypothetical protein
LQEKVIFMHNSLSPNRAERVLPALIVRGARSPEDTAAGCKALAASDHARAALMDTQNGRGKLQHSAARWEQRAELLQRLEASSSKRRELEKLS